MDNEFEIPAASTVESAPVVTTPPTPVEQPYQAEELIAAAKTAFGVDGYVMRAMLKYLGKTQMTRSEAEQAVKDFMARPA